MPKWGAIRKPPIIYKGIMSTRINRQITTQQVRVIDNSGTNLGPMSLSNALAIASQAQLDLIEIVPNVIPPVCKIMEYGKFMYEQKKSHKQQKTPELKEFRFNVNIDTHDLQIKANQIAELLGKKHPIKIVVRFRGREISHKETGTELLTNLKSLLSAYTFEPIVYEDKQLLTSIKPK